MIKQCLICGKDFDCGRKRQRAGNALTCCPDHARKYLLEYDRQRAKNPKTRQRNNALHMRKRKEKRMSDFRTCVVCGQSFIRWTNSGRVMTCSPGHSQIYKETMTPEWNRRSKEKHRVRNNEKHRKYAKTRTIKIAAALATLRELGIQI